MPISKNHDLSQLNTFKLQSKCEFFLEVHQISDLDFLFVPNQPDFQWQKIPKRILGGGSNLILSEKISGLVLQNKLKGILVTDRFVHVASGENWHDFVGWCLQRKLYGLENLSLIPGTVGAAPIQNIGAYGVEVKKFIYSVKGLHLNSGLKQELLNPHCHFEYRHSIFKTEPYKDFLITEVVFQFPEKHELEYNYGELKEFFQSTPPSPEKIAQKVIEIRSRKLPDLKMFPNVGSYFKNPLITNTSLENIKKLFPQIISHPYDQNTVKLSAGQLIELCGFKGKAFGKCSMYEKQALVMVNIGSSSYHDVLILENNIIEKVKNTFGILLEAEPIKW